MNITVRVISLFLLSALISNAGLLTSCATHAKKSNSEKNPSSVRSSEVTGISPANEIQKKIDEELRPLLTESFGDVKIVSAVSSDNVDSGVGGWMNYSVESGINREKLKSFKKHLKNRGFLITQDMTSPESGRLLFNMIIIKELPDVNYNLNVGTLEDEDNIISVFVTAEKVEDGPDSEK